ncbi:putative nuclear segregation protein [Phaeoacremonium minimum UCRPA7]|uniref:Putative nuclear segregation protein n=1 Tax=Phaeoacremonium minimum (strain UCR-PA7) TaxID=1286976 RepID=R8BB81_PHAM7|nr:putative nuclear segregation protein [Phaeoacremonium minimum UCRPA7]EON96556.1 putative nuclear segregation protein [Phaeoacremonium minimum UCRPA7]
MADSTATAAAAAPAAKPQKPDEALYKEQLAKAEKEHSEVMTKYKAIKEKIELAQPNKNSDTPNPTQKRRQELIAQANEIRQKQAGGKNTRNTKLDQIKRIDEQLRSRINEQKNAKSKVPFKSVEDVDREINRLESQVNGGMMKLVDEKKALAEISSLRKQRKNFSQFDDQQKSIDDLRAKIKEIKDSMDDPEAKALSDQYTKIQTELDAIKAEQDGAYKNLSGLRDERTKLQAQQREKYDAIKKLKDEYYGAKKAFAAYEREAKQKAWERNKAERDRIVKEQKKERAQKMLAEASDPAYLEEIRRANSLLHFFDPSHVSAEKAPLLADSGLGAQAQRKVDDSGMKGTRLVRKEDRDEDYAPAVKKGKKGKKGGAAESAKFNLPPSVVEDCSFMNIDPPMSASDVPAAVEKIKAKLDHWKSDQAAQTQRNVEKAKKEIEKLEADEAAESGTATPNGVNGKKGEDKAVADVTADLKDSSLEDKKEEVAA